jgi:hypothetical protein
MIIVMEQIIVKITIKKYLRNKYYYYHTIYSATSPLLLTSESVSPAVVDIREQEGYW